MGSIYMYICMDDPVFFPWLPPVRVSFELMRQGLEFAALFFFFF